VAWPSPSGPLGRQTPPGLGCPSVRRAWDWRDECVLSGPAPELTSSVSGNAIYRSCFRFSALSSCIWSTIVRWRPSLSVAVVTQLVTHHRARSPACLSMRTIGNEVSDGRLRRRPGGLHRSGTDSCRPGCCILLPHRFLVIGCLRVHFMVKVDLDVPSQRSFPPVDLWSAIRSRRGPTLTGVYFAAKLRVDV
jgi:hypothetical protein